jgi:simple sugar transport system substrate-binding protein
MKPTPARRAARLFTGATIAALFVSSGCDDRSADRPSAEDAEPAARIVVVTHGQSADPFWSVVANGARDAGRELGVRVEYQAPLVFDMVEMSDRIAAAVASRPDGLVVSIPDGDALGASIRQAVDAAVPVVSINSGDDVWRALGVLAHIGQTEYEAGWGAGERLAAAGTRHALCINHEVGNVSLDHRCDGLAGAMAEAGGHTDILAVDLADPDDAEQRIRSAWVTRPTLDGALALGPAGAIPALAALADPAADRVAFATFDLSPEVLEAVERGDALFAIDQQQYLQGYLAVVLLAKYLETGAMPGGGQVIRTGPGFVTAADAAAVVDRSKRGLR